MKTTVDIPDGIMKDVFLYSRKKTKRDAILTAMREYIQVRKMRKLAEKLGTLDRFMTQDDLKKMREDP